MSSQPSRHDTKTNDDGPISATVAHKGMRKEVIAVMPGLVLAMLLSMLDNFIVSTSLPRIVGDLGGVTHLSWVVTAYILGTTVSTPIWGKVGDMFGRKTIFLISITVFLVGSALSGTAGSALLGGTTNGMTELIAFRALQGLGAGGLMVNVMAITGDLVPPRERGRYQGVMAAVMSLAMIAGPLAGGLITDHLTWRWTFYINLPLGIAALILVATTLRLPQQHRRVRIDWLGAVLLTAAITSLVILTSLGGSQFAWLPATTAALAAGAVVTFALFILVERRTAEPILPLHIFAHRNFSLISGVGFLLGFAMFGSINFLPLFQQTVQGASATNSGALLIPMMGASMVVSLFVGQRITKTGHYKAFPVAGGIVIVVAMFLLAQQDAQTTPLETGLFIAVLGTGMGFLMQTTMLISQNSVDHANLGVASSTATFFRSIGGAFGVSWFGGVFNQRLAAEMTARLGENATGLPSMTSANIDPATLDQLSPPVRAALFNSLAAAISEVFLVATIFAAVIVLLAALLKHVPLRESNPTSDCAPAANAPAATCLSQGSGKS